MCLLLAIRLMCINKYIASHLDESNLDKKTKDDINDQHFESIKFFFRYINHIIRKENELVDNDDNEKTPGNEEKKKRRKSHNNGKQGEGHVDNHSNEKTPGNEGNKKKRKSHNNGKEEERNKSEAKRNRRSR